MYTTELSWVLGAVALTLSALTAFAVNASRRAPLVIPAADSR